MIEVRGYLEGQVADGQFPLIRYLGGNEHTAVFLTECAESENHKAAIKLIPAPPGNSEAQLTRWRLAAKFSHPNLLRLFHMGRCTLDNSSMLYLVMEYAEENLAEILSERPLSPAETRDMLGPTLEALGYLHGKGFIHGRVQPSNIMAIDDRVKLSSDGICRIGESIERRNGHGRNSAPESAAGALSPASDVWSLGMTLVECLTQHPPKIEEGSRQGVSLPADLPAPFLELARHCLNHAPQRRSSVANLKARLERNPNVVEEAAPPVRSQAPSKRRYPRAWTVAGVTAAAILLAAALFHPSSKTQGARSAGIQSPPQQPTILPVKAEDSRAAQPRRSENESSAEVENHGAPATKPVALHSTAAGGVDRDGVVHRALPNVPPAASDTIWGTVRVRVRVNVDPSGNVVSADFDSPGPSSYFAGLSMDAARQWKFRPSGASASSDWLIRFHYTKGETTATAEEQNP